ncbi:MAG: LemA family protein [Rhodocyclaceae bacterium]|nr:LemA family protein [Rhodocyclaceae bacterium]
MSLTLMLLLAVLGAAVLWGIVIFNRLVARRNHAREAWSGIDVQLKRRHDLLPKLVEAVKAYAGFERSVQAASVEARAGASRSELERTENALTGQLRGLLAVVEAYPDLKASRSYLDLQQQITEAEEQIQYARRYYNGTVRELNILIDSFPSNLVARLFGYVHRDYFEIELATQRDSPALPFS